MPFKEALECGTNPGFHLYLITIRPDFHIHQRHLNIYGFVNLWEKKTNFFSLKHSGLVLILLVTTSNR